MRSTQAATRNGTDPAQTCRTTRTSTWFRTTSRPLGRRSSTWYSGSDPEQGEVMRTRNLGLPLLASGLLAALLAATPIAQTQQLVPNGPAIPTIALTGGGSPPPAAEPAPGPKDRPSAWNMEVVGHNDLQGRSAYQPIIINQDGRQIAYVGHHNNQKPLMNPLTGKLEVSGTSIVDVTDPAKTKYLAHIATGEDR